MGEGDVRVFGAGNTDVANPPQRRLCSREGKHRRHLLRATSVFPVSGNIDVDGEGCETNLNGIYLGKEKNHTDNHTIVDHLKPNCNSNEVYKGILDDNSVGVFNGKVFVRPDAQKTNAFQQNNNITTNPDIINGIHKVFTF